ncbi:MAG: DUF1015 domain-containing protein [Candidatus Methanomethylophilaceae archaeon]|jgi:uncharacterized protein (DUF1015 family)|nr:DUF1015 domain-containing protein [Candidatus Methanomethylophilaceae archaeon]NCA73895.1 DUF1015 domain-containing protein [Gammaproteobacteria bacterium]MDD2936275.1 DUF1015 domain-containing protein [Candidatus Methanomethylophilaceae archaeon]MDD3351987.1 DUF1015 domain-containing protein [Candidatus Methanomethylophilaceae archaeon]MDD3987285.1 DUF1015 domain-containing protein [Candidatus Methanomethylophilaceae archaeon]
MVTFLPFPGYRPAISAGDSIGDRISPPYDVIDPSYLVKLQSKAHNITRLTLNPDPDRRYRSSRRELDGWMADGSLKQDAESFYIYEQTFEDGGEKMTRTGIVGILKTEPYEDGNVVPHEETFSKVKADRLNLLRDMESHLESIFGIHDSFGPELNRKIRDNAALVYRYVDDDGVEHRYSRLSDEKICNEITYELSDQKMLIADGHHRYETALAYSQENRGSEKKGYVLATLVSSSDPGLSIWPTHRLVKTESISEKNAIRKMSESLEMEEVSAEEMEKDLGNWMMGLRFRSGKCYLARYPGEGLWALDTYVAQEKILKDVYKWDEGKSQVDYDAELTSVNEKMSAGGYDLAIVLNRPDLETVWDLSMQGKRMPKKTTYFFPKIWSGFVIYRMD